MLDSLYQDLVVPARKLAELEAQLSARSYEVLEDERRKRTRSPIQERLKEAAVASAVQLASGPAVGSLRWMGHYETFLVGNGSDLTKWNERGNVAELPRLHQIPMIRSDTGQMAFGRIAKTRISYIHWSVGWRRKWIWVGPEPYEVVVELPRQGCNEVNVVARLGINGVPRVDVSFLFDGLEFGLVRVHHSQVDFALLPDEVDRVAVVRAVLDDASERGRFFSNCFQDFVFSTLGRENPNAGEYFTDKPCSVDLVSFHGTPVLVVTPIHDVLGDHWI
jgi:hypothetical protein